jgi:hypothetical protein
VPADATAAPRAAGAAADRVVRSSGIGFTMGSDENLKPKEIMSVSERFYCCSRCAPRPFFAGAAASPALIRSDNTRPQFIG